MALPVAAATPRTLAQEMGTPLIASADNFRAWKIWRPVSEVFFFLGVGIYYLVSSSGIFVLMDTVLGLLISVAIMSAIWRSAVLRDVKIDQEKIYISDLRTTETVPLRLATGVIDRTHMKRWVPSTILLDDPNKGRRRVRFIPARPTPQVIAELQRRIAQTNSGSQQAEALKP